MRPKAKFPPNGYKRSGNRNSVTCSVSPKTLTSKQLDLG